MKYSVNNYSIRCYAVADCMGNDIGELFLFLYILP